MFKKYQKYITSLAFFCLLLIMVMGAVYSAKADSLIQPDKYSQGCLANGTYCGCIANGTCEINDFVRLMINVSKIILGITGSLALAAFIAGGIVLIVSSGNAEKVKQGQQIILGAVIGLVIVFTSFMIIQFVYQLMGIGDKNWWTAPGSAQSQQPQSPVWQ